jgi:hypothetical protein
MRIPKRFKLKKCSEINMEMCLKIYSKNINKKIGKKHLKGKITKDKNHQIEFNYRKNNN